jgi:hypothetical protein|tara:strand:- start:2922 stop:3440 length:519 start_codon:yes stop_codon:yes gene_type:complete
MIDIIDDYLPEHEHRQIYDYFTGSMDDGTLNNSCAWVYIPFTSTDWTANGERFHFAQLIYAQHQIISPAFNLMTPIIKRENMTAIARIKANCVMKTSELDVYDDEFHTDFTGTLTTGIYYINSNDGYTLFEDGTKCESVANRFCRFPCETKHTATTCTSTNRRLLINFNYHA